MVTLSKVDIESVALITNMLGVNILSVPRKYVFREITDNQFEVIIDNKSTGVVVHKGLKDDMIRGRKAMYGVLN